MTKPGLCGLANLGNTCFMNSALQCLNQIHPVIRFFIDDDGQLADINTNDDNGLEIVKAYSQLVRSMWSGQYSCVAPRELKLSIGRVMPQFSDYRQHDCQEFMALMLGAVHDQLNIAPRATQRKAICDVDGQSVCKAQEETADKLEEDRLSPIPGTMSNVPISASMPEADSCIGSEATSPKSSDSTASTESSSLVSEEKKFPNTTNQTNASDLVENFRNPFVCSIAPEEEHEIDDIDQKPPIKRIKAADIKHCEPSQVIEAIGVGHEVQVFTEESATAVLVPGDSHPQKRIKVESIDSGVDKSLNGSTTCSSERGEVLAEGEGAHEWRGEVLTEGEGAHEWQGYVSENKSIIVDTFQGQFKSQVMCASCRHLSVTFEPFMYLAVPLPHVLEKQIVITFMSKPTAGYGCQDCPPIKFLVTLNKHDRVSKLIEALKELLVEHGSPLDTSSFLKLAEVKKNCIEKLLDASTFIRQIDSDSTIHAYELPIKEDEGYICPELDPITVSPIVADTPSNSFRNIDTPPPATANMEWTSAENFKEFNLGEPNPSPPHYSIMSPMDDNDDGFEETRSSMDKGTPLPLTPNVSPIKLSDDSSSEKTSSPSLKHFDLEKTSAVFNWKTDFNCSLPQMPETIWKHHSCVVCLEEKIDDDLLVHPEPCKCIICPSCLDGHFKHNADKETEYFACPTCSSHVNKSDYVSLSGIGKELAEEKPKLIFVPILFRTNEEWPGNGLVFVNRPALLQLPSRIDSQQLYSAIEPLVPLPVPFRIHYVERKGSNCSRCTWGSPCTGCEVSRFGTVYLHGYDSLAVHIDVGCLKEFGTSSLELAPSKHKSMDNLSPPKELKLTDCIKAFSDTEILDEDNPWWCPMCSSNQRAQKSLSLWRTPDILMVYLKRFIFYDLTSIKIDEPVTFPIDNFDLSPFLSDQQLLPTDIAPGQQAAAAPAAQMNNIYSLRACVCHSGGVGSGHYTAYARHLVDNQWHYFNDENVTERTPQPNDEHVYILFYQRNDANCSESLKELLDKGVRMPTAAASGDADMTNNESIDVVS